MEDRRGPSEEEGVGLRVDGYNLTPHGHQPRIEVVQDLHKDHRPELEDRLIRV